MRRLAFIALVTGCGGGHEMADPTSVPIDAITYDAVFVVNGGDNTISVINAEADELAATIQLQNVEFPHHVYLSADGDTMLVAIPGGDLSGGHGEHGGGGAVMVLDAATGATRAARRLDAANHNAIFGPGGGAIWTSQAGQPGSIVLLDPQTLETTMIVTVENDPSEVTFDTSGMYAFAANTGSDSVTVLDATTAEVVDTLAVGDTPVGAWPGSDGLMYVDNEAGQSLSVIDPATVTVTQTIDLGFTPALAAVSPAGEVWVTDTDAGRLVFLAAADGAVLGDLATGAGAHAIVFSPDGTKAYVTNQVANTVSVVDVAAKSVVKTIDVGSKPNGMAYRTN